MVWLKRLMWWAPTACLAVLVVVLASRGQARDEVTRAETPPPKDDGVKKEAPKKEAAPGQRDNRPRGADKAAAKPNPPAVPDVNEMIRRLGMGDMRDLDALREQMSGLRQQALDAMRQHQLRMQQLQNRGFGRHVAPAGGARPGGITEQPVEVRPSWLGARLAAPDRTLVTQLDLPRGQGMVVQEAGADSAAAKAGLKPYDILLELGDRPVPSKADEFAKLVQQLKPNEPVDVVVMRQGVKKTLRGLRLPPEEVAGAQPAEAPRVPPAANVRPVPVPRRPVAVDPSVTVEQLGDGVTIRQGNDRNGITILGRVNDGLTIRSIIIRNGSETRTYDRPDRVPDGQRERVRQMIEQGTLRAQPRGKT